LRFTLVVNKLDNPYLVAYDRILRRYGSGCMPKEPIDAGEYWRVPIEAYVPKHIIDEKTNREKILTFQLSNIGDIYVQKDTLKIINAPKIKEIRQAIIDKKAFIRNSVERDLVKVLGDPKLKVKFGKMKFAFFGLQPIYRTIINLLDETYTPLDDIKKIKYFDLIELIIKLDYASISQDNKLVTTNKLDELYTLMGSSVATAEAFLGIMLANYYEYLSQTLRIIHFVPYIRVSTSYFAQAIEFGDRIRMSIDNLKLKTREYYKKMPSYTIKRRYGIPTLVTELIEADVFEYEGDFIKGRGEIYDKLSYLRNTMPITEDIYVNT